MATLQKFKFLATQCAVAGSPSRSPTTSPVFQLRRRKTLRMLFSRKFSNCRDESTTDLQRILDDQELKNKKKKNKKSDLGSHKLKDLFISSPSPPPPLDGGNGKLIANVRDNGKELIDRVMNRRSGSIESRPILSTFRYRLIRRSWRPVLLTISE